MECITFEVSSQEHPGIEARRILDFSELLNGSRRTFCLVEKGSSRSLESGYRRILGYNDEQVYESRFLRMHPPELEEVIHERVLRSTSGKEWVMKDLAFAESIRRANRIHILDPTEIETHSRVTELVKKTIKTVILKTHD